MSRERRRRWLGRAAVVGWIALGVLATLVAPEEAPIAPEIAEHIFGDARTIHSSAPGGVMAFALVLERLGYEVSEQIRPEPPPTDALFVLEPTVSLEQIEIDALLGWVEAGGRLIYAPAMVALESTDDEGVDAGDSDPEHGDDVPDDPDLDGDDIDHPKLGGDDIDHPERGGDDIDDSERGGAIDNPERGGGIDNPERGDDIDHPERDGDGDGDSEDDPSPSDDGLELLPDPLRETILARGRATTNLDGARTFTLGTGRIALLDEARPLTNESLETHGFDITAPWLAAILEDVQTVAFDEGRVGGVPAEGFIAVLGRSRYGSGLALALAALVLLLLARSARRLPAVGEPPAGRLDYGGFLDALGHLLHRGDRIAIARDALLTGTRRRLGPLVHDPRAREVLARAQARLAERPAPIEITRQTEALRALEAELLKGS